MTLIPEDALQALRKTFKGLTGKVEIKVFTSEQQKEASGFVVSFTTELAREIGVSVDSEGFVNVTREMRTNIPRIYGCGDITGGVRQIVTAVGEGAIAAVSAFEDIVAPYWKK
ncbi:MAG: FAD-dependent oxidoreductase [Candidatus Thermoplasmatota archaeon]